MSDDNDQRKAVPPSPRSMRELLGERAEKVPAPADPREGEVVVGEGCASLPERLLLHHAEGEVLFLAGAGVSMPKPACLPSFTKLVLKVYEQLGDPVLPHLEALAGKEVEWPEGPPLKPDQKAEVKSFENGQLDVVLGMLERRIDGQETEESRMRQAVVDVLEEDPSLEHAGIHRDLMRLSDRGGSTAILTTNFDLLLEAAARAVKSPVESLALGAIPRPSLRPSFSGVLHLHGALSPERSGTPDLILTNRDFGEFYLRRRIVPDLLYDAARIYHLVLVGYTANDPPVRYLLDAISADDARFSDLKERFIFVPFKGKERYEVALADWKARGLTPIPYARAAKHRQLAFTLEAWADFFEKRQALGDGRETTTEQRVRERLERITENRPDIVSDEDRRLFDHLIRREAHARCAQLADHLGELRRDFGWLGRIVEVIRRRVGDTVPGGSSLARPPGEVQRAAHCVRNFARRRLEETATIQWARQLTATDLASRRGLQQLLSRKRRRDDPLREPWCTAWQLVEESWRPRGYGSENEELSGSWKIKARLEHGERSFLLAEHMAEFVAPWLCLDDRDRWMEVGDFDDSKPRGWRDLFRASLGSVPRNRLRELALDVVSESDFLLSLIRSLEAVVGRGLDLGRRIGWEVTLGFWQLGELPRLGLAQDDPGEEVDTFHVGIAPSVELLNAAVRRLSEVSTEAASDVVRGWRHTRCPVHRRLWAVYARDPRFATPLEVKEVLLGLREHEVWLADSYPELAEVRTLRFGELDLETQEKLLARLRRGPQLARWPHYDSERFEEWALMVAVREMARIREVAGRLPTEYEDWLTSQQAGRPDVEPSAIAGPLQGRELVPDAEQSESGLDRLEAGALLVALEEQLASEEPFYDQGAGTWLRNEATKVLGTMEDEATNGLDYPHLWRALGLQHRPPEGGSSPDRTGDAPGEARQMVGLLARLGAEGLGRAVEEFSFWWLRWEKFLGRERETRQVWLRLWLEAAAATNARSGGVPLEHARLNTSAGRLASAVLRLAPDADEGTPLSGHPEFGELLVSIGEAGGRSRLLGLAHLALHIRWLWRADRVWCEEHLVGPLKQRCKSAMFLWETLCRFGLNQGLLEDLVTDAMELAEGGGDPKLSQESRQRLLSVLAYDALAAALGDREPLVESLQLRQLLRRLNVEMRASCAADVWRWLSNRSDDSPAPEVLYRKGVAPFLDRVWPQERNLVTVGVSRWMAALPAESGGEFPAAVDSVARFLVPGSTDSRHDYGLYAEEDDEEGLDAIVDSPEKAGALLRLLDLTVGDDEGVHTPFGLDELLDHIRKRAPALVERPEFARLTTMAQRSRFE